MTTFEASIPIPPSNNRYYRHARGRNYISAEGKAYKAKVYDLVRQDGLSVFFDIRSRVAVSLQVYPANNRRRDLDNYPKAIFDALTHAGVWEDDTIVDELHIVRKGPDKDNPRIVLVVNRL